MIHSLKTDPAVFDAVKAGRKRFEIRYDDRDFKVGHRLRLLKTKYTGEEMRAGAELIFTGDGIEVVVDYILRGPLLGLLKDWVIMSISIPSSEDINEEWEQL